MAERREVVKVTADISGFTGKMAAAGAAAQGFARELESADGRMTNLIQAGLALAPALVPIGAAAVPAIAGLTLQLGLAAGAAGVAVLAFHGIGTALKALDTYQVAPTAAHFAALQTAMDKLGPAGGEFVLALDKMKPQLQGFQNVAEAGLLPGVTDGLHEVIALMPRLQEVIFTIASTMGDLARESGKALGGPEMTKFFDYLNVTARPVLTEMGQTLGNFVGGLANMLMAFDPLSRSFSTGFLNMSKSFNEWAAGLSGSQGFQNFVDYVQKAGPAAADALGSILDALVQLTEAAAPVGQVVLPIISALADGLASLANSPVGPLLISTAAAVGVLGRSMALLKAVGLTGGLDGKQGFIGKALGVNDLKGALPAMREASAATTALGVAQKEAGLVNAGYLGSLRASSVGIETLGKETTSSHNMMLASAGGVTEANKKLATASERVATAEKVKGTALRGSAAAFGKSAALAGGLALATSGLADKTGLSNTASLALMGTIAGPWGAAIGGGVGLAMDFAAANNGVEEAMRNAASAAKASVIDFGAQQASLDVLSKTSREYNATVKQGSSATNLNPFKALTADIDMFTHSSEKSSIAAGTQSSNLLRLKYGAGEVSKALGGSNKIQLASNDVLSAFATKLAPAAAKAGLNLRDVFTTGLGMDKLVSTYQGMTAVFDSASGKSKAVADAMNQLGNQMDTNVSQADALKNAMDSLFGVAMNQSAATDAWAASLDAMGKQLKSTNGDLAGQNAAARANRAAVMGSVQALEAKVNADAAVDGSGKHAAETLLKGRDAIIAQARAAGASEPAIKKYLNTLNLTPKNLTTFITENGSLSAGQKVKALTRLYGLTPKQVKTLVSQAGMGRSQADIDALARKYHLTPKQVHTLLSATDAATSKAQTVKNALAALHDKNVKIGANVAGLGAVMGLAAGINALHDKSVNINVSRTGASAAAAAGSADGSTVPKDGGPYTDRFLYLLAPGEEVVTNRHGEADRFRAMRAAGQIPGLANGGTAGGAVGLANELAVLGVVQQIRDLNKQLAARNKLVKNKKTGKVTGGGLVTTGLDREVLRLQLESAKIDLTTAKHKGAADAKEKATAIGAAKSSFSSGLTGIIDPRPDTMVNQVRDQLATFKAAFKDAGGKWTNAMSRQAVKLVDGTKVLQREQAARDVLTASLDDSKAALDTLTQTMASYSDSVSGQFTDSPFARTHAATADPATSAAQAQLAALRNSPGGDSVGSAAAASKLIAQIAAASSPDASTLTGLDALRDSLSTGAKDATAMAASLRKLSAEGLNKDLFGRVAASGDVATAGQLAALSPGDLSQINAMWNSRATAAAQVAAFATQQVYGAQQAALRSQITAQSAQIAAQSALIVKQTAVLDVLGDRVEYGAAAGTHKAIAPMQADIKKLSATVAGQARQIQTLQRANTGKGRH